MLQPACGSVDRPVSWGFECDCFIAHRSQYEQWEVGLCLVLAGHLVPAAPSSIISCAEGPRKPLPILLLKGLCFVTSLLLLARFIPGSLNKPSVRDSTHPATRD